MSSAPPVVALQSNEPDRNRVMAFRREQDGSLAPMAPVETGGAGDGHAHLQSQGSVTMTGDGRYLLVTNAGSGDLSLFAVEAGGLTHVQSVPAGAAPRSVAEHAGLVYVLATGDPSVSAFRIQDGRLAPIEGSKRPLGSGADPAQVGFTPDGAVLVVTKRGTNAIGTFPVDGSGALGEPRMTPSSGPTPYGFAVSHHGVLVVTEAFGAQVGKAAASSYRFEGGQVAAVSNSIGNSRSEICWAVFTPDGRHAFTTNFADGAISRYDLDTDGKLQLGDATAGITEDGRHGLRDLDLDGDGAFLYALDADSQQVYGWSVGPEGVLAPVGSWGGLPATAAGLAAG